MLQIKHLNKVPGWFHHIDQQVFDTLLTIQNRRGNLLEIGTYLGKTAIYMGKYLRNSETLHVCDIFDLPPTDESNQEEIVNSYESLSLSKFKENYLRFHKFLPQIHVCDSSNLEQMLGDVKFRFIHIDGSHLYPNVNQDIEFAINHLEESDGIIVLDDYRAPHTPAVANAMWENVSRGRLRVLILTENKAYLVREKSCLTVNELEHILSIKRMHFTSMKINEEIFLRILPESNKPLQNPKQLLGYLIPPITFSLIARLKPKL